VIGDFDKSIRNSITDIIEARRGTQPPAKGRHATACGRGAAAYCGAGSLRRQKDTKKFRDENGKRKKAM